jgi:hypothetical protein
MEDNFTSDFGSVMPLLASEQWSGVSGSIAELFLDAEQLVVLRHPIGTRCRTGFDLSGR